MSTQTSARSTRKPAADKAEGQERRQDDKTLRAVADAEVQTQERVDQLSDKVETVHEEIHDVREATSRLERTIAAVNTNLDGIIQEITKPKETKQAPAQEPPKVDTMQNGGKDGVKDDAKKGAKEAIEDEVRTARQKVTHAISHVVPVNRKEVGQLGVGFVIGYFTGGMTGGAVPYIR